MKNSIIASLSLFIILLFSISVNAQTQKIQNALGLNFGLNYSDLNYGTEFMEEYMPKMDYLLYSAGGDADYGYYTGILYTRKLTSHLLIDLGAAFQKLGYKIEAEVNDLNPNVNRPPSSSIPISAVGALNYYFYDLNATFEYSFSRYVNQGFYLKAGANYLMHSKTAWKLDVVFEDQSEGSDTDFTKITEPEYNGLLFVDFGLGYHIGLSEKISISPEVNFSYGLNGLVDEELAPTIIRAGISIRRWF
jgi:hypothetical protein